MLPYLRLGPFLLHTPGLALLVGLWVGLSLAEREAKRIKLKSDHIYNMVFYGLIGGLVGARLVYAARYANVYLENPLSLFALNVNTLSVGEGLLIGLLIAWAYTQRKEMSLKPTLDALAPGLAVFLVFSGIGHLLSGDAFGAPTRLPWSIYLWNEYRHPSQAYEILAALGVLYLVWKRPLGDIGSGLTFIWFIALIAGARLFLEAFRGDSLIWPGGFRAAQVISLPIMLAALWMIRSRTQFIPNGLEIVQQEES